MEDYGCSLSCCIYLSYLLTVCAYVIIRVSVFQAHREWRANLHVFPEECSDWSTQSEQGGCTRLVLEEAGCVRAEKIRKETEIIFDVQTVAFHDAIVLYFRSLRLIIWTFLLNMFRLNGTKRL